MKFLASGPGTGTDTQVDPTGLLPFTPNTSQRDDLPSDLQSMPVLGVAKVIAPDDDVPGDVYTVKIPVTIDIATSYKVTDYGYLVFVGDDQNIAPVNSLLSYASPENKKGVLIIRTPVNPTKIKVTILTKKEVSVRQLA